MSGAMVCTADMTWLTAAARCWGSVCWCTADSSHSSRCRESYTRQGGDDRSWRAGYWWPRPRDTGGSTSSLRMPWLEWRLKSKTWRHDRVEWAECSEHCRTKPEIEWVSQCMQTTPACIGACVSGLTEKHKNTGQQDSYYCYTVLLSLFVLRSFTYTININMLLFSHSCAMFMHRMNSVNVQPQTVCGTAYTAIHYMCTLYKLQQTRHTTSLTVMHLRKRCGFAAFGRKLP